MTTIIGRLAVRPRQAGGFLIEDRDTNAVLPVSDLKTALHIAALMHFHLARGASLGMAYDRALTERGQEVA